MSIDVRYCENRDCSQEIKSGGEFANIGAKYWCPECVPAKIVHLAEWTSLEWFHLGVQMARDDAARFACSENGPWPICRNCGIADATNEDDLCDDCRDDSAPTEDRARRNI